MAPKSYNQFFFRYLENFARVFKGQDNAIHRVNLLKMFRQRFSRLP